MDFKYVDDYLPRRIDGWYSPTLGMQMPIVTYGDRGRPLLLFPTAAADFLENERFYLVKAVEPAIFAGRIRVFSIDSINKHAWMDKNTPVPEQARRQALYARYVEDEVVPYIRAVCGNGGVRVATTGASFGAYHAANFAARYPHVVSRAICFSGVFDIHSFLDGHWDDNCYFNCPTSYIPNMDAEWVGKLSRVNWIIATGENDTLAQQNRDFSALLWAKGIPNHLELWPGQFGHDWPWWREHLRRFV
jgi:esterase/lipase superfamily enzyme